MCNHLAEKAAVVGLTAIKTGQESTPAHTAPYPKGQLFFLPCSGFHGWPREVQALCGAICPPICRPIPAASCGAPAASKKCFPVLLFLSGIRENSLLALILACGSPYFLSEAQAWGPGAARCRQTPGSRAGPQPGPPQRGGRPRRMSSGHMILF